MLISCPESLPYPVLQWQIISSGIRGMKDMMQMGGPRLRPTSYVSEEIKYDYGSNSLTLSSRMTTLSAASMHVEHDPKKNFSEYEKYVEEAAKVRARVLALPECSLQGFIWTWDEEKKTFTDDPEQKRYYEETAETIPGPTTEKIARLA